MARGGGEACLNRNFRVEPIKKKKNPGLFFVFYVNPYEQIAPVFRAHNNRDSVAGRLLFLVSKNQISNTKYSERDIRSNVYLRFPTIRRRTDVYGSLYSNRRSDHENVYNTICY